MEPQAETESRQIIRSTIGQIGEYRKFRNPTGKRDVDTYVDGDLLALITRGGGKRVTLDDQSTIFHQLTPMTEG